MQRMKMKSTVPCALRIGAWSLIVVAILAGCSGAPKVTRSGFLPDYSQLKPDPAADEAMTWLAPNETLRQYKQFIIDPVVVHFAPNAKGTAIDPVALKELSDYFHAEVVKALTESGRYKAITVPGPGVARIRVAITDISKTIPIANIHPATKLSGVGLGGAAMEAEMVDSISGERLGAVVDSQSGGRLGIVAGLQTYGHAKQVMDGWVKRFVKRMDHIHGYTGK
ncbi:hypothetical protein MELA_00942 [Candidatus Methylomirabilis lanthanidiphila]|uniref:DUF3313 domain-containing protein n=1 Tax=Candidatus Methylomirabilis lanthanidiphila TaxID=2211376 RepID=A0A564ZGW9_9BACT|nr:DUF3313 domain-containing protein [Candidatus Methylomirabilis lanthanidiphila]VUZ84569.1 hypothetical protein MELA_00942 [Candidatus Methylomirabilis lanthanidiphila]